MPEVASPTQITLAAGDTAPSEKPRQPPRQKTSSREVDRSGLPTEILTLNALLRDNAQLRRQLRTAQAETEAQRAEKSRETSRLAQRVAELRAELAGHETAAARLAGQLHTPQQDLPDLRERQSLARRATDAEARASALCARLAEQESAAEHWQRRYLSTQRQLPCQPGQTVEPAADTEGAPLAGKCVLCIGGQRSAVDAYRRIVEGRGGRFLQHQAEQLENLQGIAADLALADLVVCQAGNTSGLRYGQLREECRENGTQCVFLQEPGLASFGRIVSAACTPTESITLR